MTHCGHPESSIETNGTTSYCRDCENEGNFEQWLEGQTKPFFDQGGHYLETAAKHLAREAYTKGRMIERQSNDKLGMVQDGNAYILKEYNAERSKYDNCQVLAVEKSSIPENAILCEAYVCKGQLVVLGDPDWSDNEGDESGHNCDYMGCGSLSHVVLRMPLTELANYSNKGLQHGADEVCRH